MKQIVTDTYTFSDLVGRGSLYVDKTAILHRLITNHAKQYFFARPRRFGKSLTITTLMSIFEGRRELFEGLAIDKTDYDWKQYPVLRLDMGSCQAANVEELWRKINTMLTMESERLKVPLRNGEPVTGKFEFLLSDMKSTTGADGVVLLVDEYDKPILGHLGKQDIGEIRDALKEFYSVIKTTEHLQRFTFITGVSKFSKVSIFSDLNNLTDITLSREAATLCGYTHEEVAANFGEHIAALGAENNMTPEAAFSEVLTWYNGYRFHAAAETVVNPVSLGRCLMDREFKGYWYETGTPTFLVNLLKGRPRDISNLEVPENALGTYEPSNPAIEPLLFQTGYLTIQSLRVLEDKTRLYRMGFPNREVRVAFSESLAKEYTQMDDCDFARAKIDCYDALTSHDLDFFFETLPVFFANLPYDLTNRQNEQTWQAILVVLFNFLGFRVLPEVRTNRGRIDVVLELSKEIYILELKLDKTAAEALAQIKERGYADKYRAAGKRITMIGINFSSQKRTIDAWQIEEM